MDDFTVVYRQLPRTTLLSSKEDLANDSWHCPLLVMDDPYGRIGDVLIFRYPIKHNIKNTLSNLARRKSSNFQNFLKFFIDMDPIKH